MSFKNRSASSRGFTLIELLVVIAIIALLAAIALPAYQKYQLRAKAQNIMTALEMSYYSKIKEYYTLRGKFPDSVQNVLSNVTNPTTPFANGPTVLENVESYGLVANNDLTIGNKCKSVAAYLYITLSDQVGCNFYYYVYDDKNEGVLQNRCYLDSSAQSSCAGVFSNCYDDSSATERSDFDLYLANGCP